MASSEETESNAKTLPNMFQEGLDLYNQLEKLTEPTNSPNFQVLYSVIFLFYRIY